MCMFSRFSCVQVFVTLWTTRLLCPLQGIFPTQEWNWGLLHCRRILYQLSHQGSPWALEQPRELRHHSYPQESREEAEAAGVS